MIRLRHKFLIQAFRLFDQLVLLFCLALVSGLLSEVIDNGMGFDVLKRTFQLSYIIGVLLLFGGWVAIFGQLVSYNANRFVGFVSVVRELLVASTLATFWLVLMGQLFALPGIALKEVVFFWSISCMTGIVSRVLIRQFLTVARRSGYNLRHLLIVGHNEQSLELASRIEKSPELGYKITGFLTVGSEKDMQPGRDETLSGWPVLGGLGDLKKILEEGTTDEILISLDVKEDFKSVFEVVQLGQQLGVVVRVVPGQEGAKILKKLRIEHFDGNFIVTLFREDLLLQLFVKRVIDILVSGTLMVLLLPLFCVLGILIKATSNGPVFFVQERVGMNKRRFKLYKFRSMYMDADRRKKEYEHLNEMDGPVFKMKNDPRVTPIGRVIRKTSIDELPQLFNVFLGQMSLVGPRPPLLEEVNRYEWLYRKRLSIKPGLTCLWQISGRNEINFKDWMELDKNYIDNWSLWLDIKILMMTVPVVLLGKGAS